MDCKKEVKSGEHLKHPQIHGDKAQKLMNDLAYHLHHPQFGMKGPNMPVQSPKGK
jgi:hypothetical protein